MQNEQAKRNFLIVEDNYSEQVLLNVAMQDAGLTPLINTQTANNGEQAIAAIESASDEAPFHAMLLDLNMPCVSGIEVLARLRSDVRFNNLPIIIFSNSVRQADVDECRRLKADAYIQKPIDFCGLIDFCTAIRKSIETTGHIHAQTILQYYAAAA